MPAFLLGPDDYRTMPWANGRGSTIEYVCEKRGEQVLWRFSQASVVEDGAFSHFPGIDRTIMLVTGPGFRLDFAGHGAQEVRVPFQPVGFSGDWTTMASGVTAACEDMNVMVGRGAAEASVTIHRSDALTRLSDRSLFFVWDGRWTISSSVWRGDLASRHSVLIRDEPGETVELEGLGLLVEIAVKLLA